MTDGAHDWGDGPHPSRPMVSVVIPALDEADNVPGLMARFAELAETHPRYEFELVVVDDGSHDGTGQLVLDLTKPDQRVVVVRLARSFGSHYAISAGFARCAGDCAVVFGADLQEPPSLLDDFLAHWEAGSEVVWGVRRSRAGRSFLREIPSKVFSILFTRYANLANYPPEGPSGVLVDRCVLDELNRLTERNRNLMALIAWLGFTQTRVDYDQRARRHGQSRWTTRKMFKLAADSLIQFSTMPLRLFQISGIVVAFVGLAYAVLLIVRSLLGVTTPSGWPTVLVVMLVLGGTQLTVVGVMGEYLWRGVEESRGRPLYVVRDVLAAGPGSRFHQQRAPRQGQRAGMVMASGPSFPPAGGAQPPSAHEGSSTG